MNSLLEKLKSPGAAICRMPGDVPRWGLFCSPVKILTATAISNLSADIAAMTAFIAGGGYAVCSVSYEAASAFDNAFPAMAAAGFPYGVFALYTNPPEIIDLNVLSQTAGPACRMNFTPDIDFTEYSSAFARIQRNILDGDVYQVNYTCRLNAAAVPEPEQFFLWLCRQHPVPYAAYFNLGEYQILSLSPELFLHKHGLTLESMPMKGTAPRKLSAAEDTAAAANLARDTKNIAENLMIVDMVRNDFGRICRSGTIVVNPIFKVDTYQTVHQMISRVQGELPHDTGIMAVLHATFPPASITGAPKISAVKIIAREEQQPRKIYTGTLGCFTPNGDYCLNVAIRTIINSKNGAELGVGSGLVADSRNESEWREILLKSNFVNFMLPQFQVLETMLWQRGAGVKFRSEHLERATASMHYFGWNINHNLIQSKLNEMEQQLNSGVPDLVRIRLLFEPNDISYQLFPLNNLGWNPAGVKIIVSTQPTDDSDVFLYHKTSHRQFYDHQYQQAAAAGFDEVIFFNKSGMLTEGSISNIFVNIDGEWLTPPVSAGLLPGIWRRQMLAELNAAEKNITAEQLRRADAVIIGNSVRSSASVKLPLYPSGL
jgi:para-aminobenzoate synthetase/4-amino-4-deoxychorismate lyase